MSDERSAEPIRSNDVEAEPQRPGTTVHHRHDGDGRGLGSRLRSHASEVVESGKKHVAGRIDHLGDQLEQRASRFESEGDFMGHAAANVARGGSDVLESSADYLRSHDIAAMRSSLEETIRDHPFLSVGCALWLGYRFGKLVG